MAIPIQNFNTDQLFMLCSIVCYCHSCFMICDHYLSHELRMLATLVSLTCIYLVTLYFLEIKKAYQTVYWHYFLLMSAYLSTTTSSNWNFLTGFVSLLGGFIFLSLYVVYFLWRGSSQRQEEQRPGDHSLPLLVEIAFLFICNGMAIMGRRFIPSENLRWIISEGAIMFLVSVMLFYCYFKLSRTAESEDDIHPPTK